MSRISKLVESLLIDIGPFRFMAYDCGHKWMLGNPHKRKIYSKGDMPKVICLYLDREYERKIRKSKFEPMVI